jgi:beta-lactamase regulating signal transducer with metallopeptidase domain
MLLWLIPFLCLMIPWRISSPVGIWQNAPSDYGYESLINQEEDTADKNNAGLGSTVAGNHSTGNTEIVENSGNASNGTIGNAGTDSNEIIENSGMGNKDTVEDAEINKAGANDLKGLTTSQILAAVTFLWMVGVLGLGLYSIFAYSKLKRQLVLRIRMHDNVYMVDGIEVPMVMGIIKPKIYLPSGFDSTHMEYVIAHEQTHIRRKDIIVKMVAYYITCLHWFNPLVWLAYTLMIKDMEMACDEETIRRLGQEKKQEYATALLQLASGHRHVLSVPLAFGEGSTKSRIVNILKYEKTKQILAMLALTVGLILAILFLTKGESGNSDTTEGTEATEENSSEDTSNQENTDKSEDNSTEDASTEDDTSGEDDTETVTYWRYYEWMDESMENWIETNIVANKSQWFEEYDGSSFQHLAGPNHLGAAEREDIIFDHCHPDTEEAKGISFVVNCMVPDHSNSENQPYRIIAGRGGEPIISQIDEDVWLVPYINYYYRYEGVDEISMEEALRYVKPDEMGLIPLNRLKDPENYEYIVIRQDNVYRAQKLLDMMNPSEKRHTDRPQDAIDLDKELLTWFETEFFNNPDNRMPNMFVGTDLYYESPEEIGLYEVFYNGVFGTERFDITQEEKELLRTRYAGSCELDIVKITTADMNETLLKYAGITLEESSKKGLEKFMYLEEYDAYYLEHGDARGTEYKVFTGWMDSDGMITLRLRPIGRDYHCRVTLRYEDGNYYFQYQAFEV